MVISYNTGIIVAAGVIIVGYICCRYDLTAVWWVTDYLSWLRLFLSGWILYAINNYGNESVLFRVNFVSGDWNSCIDRFTFISTLLIYRLFSSCIFQYTLLSIAAKSRTFFFPMPPSLWFLFPLPCPPRPPRPLLPRPPLPSNWPPLSPISTFQAELTCRISPYLPHDGCVVGKMRDITVNRYVEDVSKLELWLDLQMLTSVLKSLVVNWMLNKICLTLSYSYRWTVEFYITLNFYFILVTYFSKEKMFLFL